MRSFTEIATILENEAKAKYGSILNMEKETGVSKSIIYNMSSKNTNPKIKTLIEIVTILDLSLDYVLGISDNKKIPESIQELMNYSFAPNDIDFIKGYMSLSKSDKKLLNIIFSLSPSTREEIINLLK